MALEMGTARPGGGGVDCQKVTTAMSEVKPEIFQGR